MKNFVIIITMLLGLAASVSFAASDEAGNVGIGGDFQVVLEHLVNVNDLDQIAAIHAALTLQNSLTNNPDYKVESLANYNLGNPDIIRRKTKEGRHYILVMFPALHPSKNDPAAYAIIQKCKEGRMYNLVSGFMINRQIFINSFKSAAKDSSADYYEWDLCSTITAEYESE